jgi:hypothetical protein
MVVGNYHIVLAKGRDYADISPVAGIILGSRRAGRRCAGRCRAEGVSGGDEALPQKNIGGLIYKYEESNSDKEERQNPFALRLVHLSRKTAMISKKPDFRQPLQTCNGWMAKSKVVALF